MSKALTIGVVILSLITGMAGGFGTGYLIYHSQVSNLQDSQGFDSLEINATYYKDHSAIDLTFKNPTETAIYFEIKFLIYRYFSNETGEWIWESARAIRPEPSNCLILPTETESLWIYYVPHIEEADRIFILGNNFHRRITLTPVEPSEPEPGASSGAVLSVENIRFYNVSSTKYVEVIIRNAGTADATVVTVYVGISSADLAQKNSSDVSYDPSTDSGTKGIASTSSSLNVTITHDWTTGTRYYFKVVTDAGQVLPFNEKA
ncbi:MAG: hypothetical protein JSV12_04495 [Candidatus Bathyarchaeota archaeon]|nr:MAG: hypothetical protein JSV12_04495 [Candidatus Bathyarchaeota archaeon]